MWFSAIATAKPTLVFRKSSDWCPYECSTKKADGRKGFIADIVESVFVGFALREVELANELDAGITRLRTSGELAAILAGYGVADWQSQ